jgi:hypothetical protein
LFRSLNRYRSEIPRPGRDGPGRTRTFDLRIMSPAVLGESAFLREYERPPSPSDDLELPEFGVKGGVNPGDSSELDFLVTALGMRHLLGDDREGKPDASS